MKHFSVLFPCKRLYTFSFEKFIRKEALFTFTIEGLAVAIKSFRLSEERIEKYNKILEKLRIDGETESDRFRNLIDYLYDYMEDLTLPFQEPLDFSSGSTSQRMDVLDLIINVLSQHERNLDKIVRRLERVDKTRASVDALEGKAL